MVQEAYEGQQRCARSIDAGGRVAASHGTQHGEACPICHRVVRAGEASEWVPVCPLVYPETEGLRCHAECLAEERERTRLLRREDLAPTFLRFKQG